MEPSHSSSSRYQHVPQVEPASPLVNGSTSSTAPSSRSRTNSCRRRSLSNTSDVEARGRRSEEPDDVMEDAFEMDRFLPRGRSGRKVTKTSDQDEEEEDQDGLADEDESKPFRRGADDGLDPDDPITLVKRAVPETDDPTLPALTFRAVLIGSFFAILGSAVAQLFFYKSNSPGFSSYFVILVSLPIGRWMARTFPEKVVSIPYLGSFELNPGPFSIKEHLLCAIIASSGATSAYASDILNINVLFFHTRLSAIPSLVLLLSTQMLGFGFAGLVHNLLVKSPSMIFPSTLVTTSLFHTLHGAESLDMRKRLRFFIVAFLGIFCYQFLPALMAPTLSSLAILCLINNQSPVSGIVSSGYKGFGLFNLSLDWTAAGASGPLFQPWWAALNYYVGFASMMWIIMPILYFGVNFWGAQEFPSVLGSGLFTSSIPHKKFDVAAVLTPENTLDHDKWVVKGPMLLTPYFAITYGISFAILTSLLTHIFLWHWQDVKRAVSNPVHDDYHNRAMMNYEEVPKSWYLVTLGVSLGAAMLLVAFAPLQLPVWGLAIAVLIALAFLVPVGIIKAVSDTGVGLNVITEFVAGYMLPGKPIANVCFKCYGYMAMSQALDLAVDMKLALYMKIPPKHMFQSQMLGTVVGCVVNYIVLSFVLSDSSGYLPYLSGAVEDPTGQWDGRKVHIFWSASIIWGAIGPAEFFSGQYRKLYYGFLLGALAPIPFYFLHTRYSKVLSKYGINLSQVAFPILLHGMNAAPQTPTNIILSGFIAAYLSQKWAKEKKPKWFAKYNYVLSAALDAGTSINALVVFVLSVTVLKVLPMPNWWLRPDHDSEYCNIPHAPK